MHMDPQVTWDTCTVGACTGARTTIADRCPAHLPARHRTSWFGALGRGRPVDARGVTLTGGLLERTLAAVPRDEGGRAVLRRARFDAAVFPEAAAFDGVRFEHEVFFDGSRC